MSLNPPPTDAVTSLHRLFNPRSIAVVGGSEGGAMSDGVVANLRASGRELTIVNRRGTPQYGLPTFDSLESVPSEIDLAVLAVGANSVDPVLTECARASVGAAIVFAAGFAETGDTSRQHRIAERAGDRLAVLGPNCTGFVNVTDGIAAVGGPLPRQRPGGLALVSQSGALVTSFATATAARHLGVSLLVSVGNEAVLDTAAIIDHLVQDETTTVIALIVETVRSPSRFIDSLRAARQAAKPVICLKLGRSERGAAIARSHTAALAGPARIFDIVCHEHGALLAHDLDDLLDMCAPFAQLDRSRWSAARHPAILTGSGGTAGLVADLAEDHRIVLPQLAELTDWVRSTFPGILTVNPLDLTGAIHAQPELVPAALDRIATADGIDAIGYVWLLDDTFEEWGRRFLAPIADLTTRCEHPILVCSVESGPIGSWIDDFAGDVALVNGLRGLLTGIAALRDYATASAAGSESTGPSERLERREHTEPPALWGLQRSMRLLEAYGIDTPAWVVIGPSRDPSEAVMNLSGTSFAVKLAEVEHCTDIGAVFLDVPRDQIPERVRELQTLAEQLDVPGSVAVQEMVEPDAEVYIGIENTNPYGPVVMVGPGGQHVELLDDIVGRLAPISPEIGASMVSEIRTQRLVTGWRGAPAWDRTAVGRAIAEISRIAAEHADSIASIDINPIVLARGRCVVVDSKIHGWEEQ
jgi:acyl-CoA synthetase (NDP forming)